MTYASPTVPTGTPDPTKHHHCHHTHGVSWPAIIGGVFISMAISIVLFMLGSALGLSSISSWSLPDGLASFSVKAAIWLIIVQWVASGMGGYLAGRLRCKWHDGLHAHEIFFRDTAQGLLTWAVATVLMVSLCASFGGSIIGGGAKAATTVAAGASAGMAHSASKDGNEPSGYYVDTLLRSNNPSNTEEGRHEQNLEVARILANGFKNDGIPDTDKTYLAGLISAHSGISQADAEKRIDDTVAQMNAAKEKVRQTAEEARKTTAQITYYLVLAMFIGAFVASAAAAFGGSQRDEY